MYLVGEGVHSGQEESITLLTDTSSVSEPENELVNSSEIPKTVKK